MTRMKACDPRTKKFMSKRRMRAGVLGHVKCALWEAGEHAQVAVAVAEASRGTLSEKAHNLEAIYLITVHTPAVNHSIMALPLPLPLLPLLVSLLLVPLPTLQVVPSFVCAFMCERECVQAHETECAQQQRLKNLAPLLHAPPPTLTSSCSAHARTHIHDHTRTHTGVSSLSHSLYLSLGHSHTQSPL